MRSTLRHPPHPQKRSDVTLRRPAERRPRFSFSQRARPVQHLINVLVPMTTSSKQKPDVEFGGTKKERKEPSHQQQQEVELGHHGGKEWLSCYQINNRWR